MTVDWNLAGTIRAEPDPSETGHYYALTLSADKAANIIWSSVSQWVAEGSKPMWEMRAPGLIDPYRVQMAWSAAGQDHMVVRDRVSLGNFLRAGGNALVVQSVARQWLPNVLQPVECASVDPSMPSQPLEVIARASLAHAPSKKLRMQVLRRDDFRCRICGRRAADYVDIELHVHHIRPHGMGGLTELGNLITLCHTCHGGLDPHYEARLLSMVPGTATSMAADLCLSGYEEGRRLYRRLSVPGSQLACGIPAVANGHDVSPGPRSNAFVSPEAEDLAGLESHFLFQVWHNSLRKVVRPHENCSGVRD
jgi:HNH endonuclease